MAHVSSLTSYRLRAPGQPPIVTGVSEQRVTAFCINLLILLVCFDQLGVTYACLFVCLFIGNTVWSSCSIATSLCRHVWRFFLSWCYESVRCENVSTYDIDSCTNE